MRPSLLTTFATVLGLLTAGTSAFAQTTSTATITFSTTVNATRQGSDRAGEQSGGVIPITTPIGVRDCSCETWTFTGTYGPADTATTTPIVQFWVGSDPSLCATATNRLQNGTGVASATCWQISTDVVASQTYVANGSFTVTIPSVLLVNPYNNTCAIPPPGQSSTGTLYLYALVIDGATTAPYATQSYTYDLSLPTAPQSAAASPDDSAAHITWSGGSVVSDGGTTVADPSQSAFYVLCLPNSPAAGDAGTPCTPVTGIPAGVDSGVTDASTVVDSGTDAGAADTGTASTGDASVSCPGPLPSTFDPNDAMQFAQYVCSPMLGSSASSTDITGLVNGNGYSFYVVSQNLAGTRSTPVLAVPQGTGNDASAPACIVPVPLTDFWQHYVASGGQAQPGFCDTRPGPVSMQGTLIGALLGFAGVGWMRWRRRGRRGQDGR